MRKWFKYLFKEIPNEENNNIMHLIIWLTICIIALPIIIYKMEKRLEQ